MEHKFKIKCSNGSPKSIKKAVSYGTQSHVTKVHSGLIIHAIFANCLYVQQVEYLGKDFKNQNA